MCHAEFPSIVAWVVFNEGWGQYDTERIVNMTKHLDPSRLADCASGWNDAPVRPCRQSRHHASLSLRLAWVSRCAWHADGMLACW